MHLNPHTHCQALYLASVSDYGAKKVRQDPHPHVDYNLSKLNKFNVNQTQYH